ncbi:MAG: phage Gp37/Gp68 family protein [Kiritimatiellae bacterium]|jgi:protein gp37|nr:phage Gp37/Gp68 family protein [Kiritimatiellia bacterium]
MKNSEIEWTDHTFNPWMGCTNVSPACDHCYAEGIAKRTGKDIWGTKAPRMITSDSNWKQPLKWNAATESGGQRRRVFCGSMCDICEDRPDLADSRTRLEQLIEETSHLDWLLLTKRPGNFQRLFPWKEDWPENVWVGCTVEEHRYAKPRLKHLLRVPAAVRFISAEPLLGPLDLSEWMGREDIYPLDWIIAGGESGGGARPSEPLWYADLQRQSRKLGAAFHFKQYGNWAPGVMTRKKQTVVYAMGENGQPVTLTRYRSKKQPGRELLGRTWDELPEPHTAQELRTMGINSGEVE